MVYLRRDAVTVRPLRNDIVAEQNIGSPARHIRSDRNLTRLSCPFDDGRFVLVI